MQERLDKSGRDQPQKLASTATVVARFKQNVTTRRYALGRRRDRRRRAPPDLTGGESKTKTETKPAEEPKKKKASASAR